MKFLISNPATGRILTVISVVTDGIDAGHAQQDAERLARFAAETMGHTHQVHMQAHYHATARLIFSANPGTPA